MADTNKSRAGKKQLVLYLTDADLSQLDRAVAASGESRQVIARRGIRREGRRIAAEQRKVAEMQISTAKWTYEASFPCVTDTGVVGAVDVDIDIYAGDDHLSGGVTLVRDLHSGNWSSWGDIDHWVEGELLSRIRKLDLSASALRDVLQEIEAVAAAAITPDVAEAADAQKTGQLEK